MIYIMIKNMEIFVVLGDPGAWAINAYEAI